MSHVLALGNSQSILSYQSKKSNHTTCIPDALGYPSKASRTSRHRSYLPGYSRCINLGGFTYSTFALLDPAQIVRLQATKYDSIGVRGP